MRGYFLVVILILLVVTFIIVIKEIIGGYRRNSERINLQKETNDLLRQILKALNKDKK